MPVADKSAAGAARATDTLSGWQIRVQGLVQGVGFRPAVYRLAHAMAHTTAPEMSLSGDVCNQDNLVCIRLYCREDIVVEFCRRLSQQKPPRARIDHIDYQPLHGFTASGFSIRTSSDSTAQSNAARQSTAIIADLAPCADCLSELFDPTNRRYGYPFINCTQCGPRFTLLQQLPYDRANTSMADFTLCSACDHEYHQPTERRFHAQPNACADCGPHIWLETAASGQGFSRQNNLSPEQVIDQVLATIANGDIVALKGVGGFHLLCDASNADAIARLRLRKQRPGKPLAVMLANSTAAHQWINLTDNGRDWLNHPAAPIVLQTMTAELRRQHPLAAEQLAPGLNTLGVMLPQSPLHWLLFHAAAGRPAGSGWCQQNQSLALVMTSGNASGWPLISTNDQARQQLTGIADLLLMHNRDIVNRCDDSVVDAREPSQPALLQRVGRGLAPLSFSINALPATANNLPSVLALGGYLKNTIALNLGHQLCLSQHIGDLDNPQNCRQQQRTLQQLSSLTGVYPQIIACDLHPEGHARLLAEQSAAAQQAELCEVPHHVAHLAAVLAEQAELKPTLGLVLDGFGLGWDGHARGSELLLLSAPDYLPLGAFSTLALPGADAAAREPWRMAMSLLFSYGSEEQMRLWTDRQNPGKLAAQRVYQQLEQGINCPQTTSAGRWFDAIAGLLGICRQQSYEGEAAMRLEALAGQACKPPAARSDTDNILCQTERHNGALTLDLQRLAQRLIEGSLSGENPAALAWLWHQQLAMGMALWIQKAAREYQLTSVLLSGGCAQNQLLRTQLRYYLQQNNLALILPEHAPVNDGGLAVGQLAWTLLGRQSGPLSDPQPNNDPE